MRAKPLYVSEPSLVPLNQYVFELESVWRSGILTHNGPKVQLLEKRIAKLLQINLPSLVVNGTVALEICLKILKNENPKKKKVITTAFSWAASATCIYESGLEPIFCDVNSSSFNIEISEIEKNISDDVLAILPVHVFGNPCDVEKIRDISEKNNIPVVYDAAHCFGVKYKGESVLNYGTFAAVSTHATKIFNTGEGGFVVCSDKHLKENINKYRFFGYNKDKIIDSLGTNAKMNELCASLGLSNIKIWNQILEHRKKIYQYYHSRLSKISNVKLQVINFNEINFSYFPCVLHNELILLKVLKNLGKKNIFPRRYFYPDLPTQFDKNQACPVSFDLSNRIICLPLHLNVTVQDCEIIIKEIEYASKG